MEEKSAFFERLKKLMDTYKYLFVVIAVGIVVLLIPAGDNKQEVQEEKSVEFDLETFEKRIENVLEKGNGVGRVQIMLTMRSGMEYVYAEEMRLNMREQKQSSDVKDTNHDSDRKPSIVSNRDGGEQPIVIKEVYPEFMGAAVVCDGADNPKVQMYVTSVVSSLTGITSDRITVIKMEY